MAEVLVTGGDTELGRTIAGGFVEAGHNVVLAGARREDLELNAKQLDVASIVMDNTDPVSVESARARFPHHLDTLVNVPAPLFEAKDPRTFNLADHATAWHNALDATVVSAVLTVQIVGDHLRSGGSIVNITTANPRAGSVDAAVKAALADWTAGQAEYFGTRGITVNTLAPGLSAEPGYDGLGATPPSVAEEFARLAMFLSTGPARHITGQTMHVNRPVVAAVG